MMSRIARLRGVQRLYILLSLVFLWPAVVNGGAFYFPDTTAYIRGPDAMFHHALDWRSTWTQSATMADKLAGAENRLGDRPKEKARGATGRTGEDKPVLLGRSVFYGMLPFAGMAVGSDWLTILVQALIVGAVLTGFVRHFIDPRYRRAFGWTCVAAFALLAMTPLPFFTSMLMPDFMAGAGIVAAAALIMGWRRERRVGRLFWLALVAAAALMHSANILILLAMTVPALLLALARRDRTALRGVALVATGVLLGLLGEAAFAQVVTRVTGAAPIRPPFITARLIEDGPGLIYLDRTCPRSGFLLCRYRRRMPAGSDTFLWSTSPADGVFKAVTPTVQRALSAEQGRFVAAVVATFPLDVAGAALHAAGRQMALLSLVEFNYASGDQFDRIPPSAMRSIAASRAYARTMPVAMVEWLLWPITLTSIATILVASFFPMTQHAARYGAVIVTGWLANNVICGMLSTPHDRYQARIIWILPLAALLVLVRAWIDRYRASAGTPDPVSIGLPRS